MKSKTVFLTGAFIMLFISMLVFVGAFGITSPYYANNPLALAPGESANIGLGLQNMVGDQNLTFIANVTGEEGIAQIIDESSEYFVPFGSNNQISVNLRVSIPSTDPIGKTYSVKVTLTQVMPGAEGAISMGGSIEKTIPVVVGTGQTPTGAEKTAFPTWLIVVLVIVIIAIIIWLILNLRKKKQEKK